MRALMGVVDDASLDAPPKELISSQQFGRSLDVAEDHGLLFCVQIDVQRRGAPRDQAPARAATLGTLLSLATAGRLTRRCTPQANS
jgi:hypothetical protein